MKNNFIYALTLLVNTFLLISCLKEKAGVVDFSQNTPRVLTAAIQPSAVNLDLDTVNVVRLSNGDFQITTAVSVTATDADGAQDIPVVSYTFYKPGSSDISTSGTFSQSSRSADTAIYSSTLMFVTKRTDAGIYIVEFQVNDNAGLLSNANRLSFAVNRNNSRPMISNVSAPDTVVRPATGSTVLPLSVAASDSDGYGDLTEVFFKQLSPTASGPIFLYDSGNLTLHGDSLLGDGRFSVLVQIDSSNSLGTRYLVFLAKDRFGAFSDSSFRNLTITP